MSLETYTDPVFNVSVAHIVGLIQSSLALVKTVLCIEFKVSHFCFGHYDTYKI